MEVAVVPTKTEEQWVAEREAAVSMAVAAALAEADAARSAALAAAQAKAEATLSAALASAAEAAAQERDAAVDAAHAAAAAALVDLLYFATAFDPFGPLAPLVQHERHAVAQFAALPGASPAASRLTAEDLDSIVMAGRMLSMRPFTGAPLSHAGALEACRAVAVSLVKGGEEGVVPSLRPNAPALSGGAAWWLGVHVCRHPCMHARCMAGCS